MCLRYLIFLQDHVLFIEPKFQGHYYDYTVGWPVACGLRGCMLIRFSTVWLLPSTVTTLL